jgi:hypothetical protein
MLGASKKSEKAQKMKNGSGRGLNTGPLARKLRYTLSELEQLLDECLHGVEDEDAYNHTTRPPDQVAC